MPSADLGRATWPDLDGRPPSLLVVPIGATEQHGPHLPLDTDTTVAAAVASGLAQRRPDVVVAPPLPYGASSEHAGFPGTLSLGTATTTAVVVELVRSADHFAGVVVVCAHGGNAEALAAAQAVCRADGRRLVVWAPTLAALAAVAARHGRTADAHAGWVETSMMLAIAPGAVRLDRLAPGNMAPLDTLTPSLRGHGVRAVAPTGVLGDPTGATAVAGADLLTACIDDLHAAVSRHTTPGDP